jgi:hypothetical protein
MSLSYHMSLLQLWGEAACASLRFSRTARWAFALGYVISSMIQAFVTRERMKRSIGGAPCYAVRSGGAPLKRRLTFSCMSTSARHPL